MAKNNKNLAVAKRKKNDEFFTPYEEIERELKNYGERGLFENKKIILPTDLPWIDDANEIRKIKSMFHKFLSEKKDEYGIKSISTSFYDANLTIEENKKLGYEKFQDIDYSDYDILITNPPFSQFRDLLKVINNNNLEFIILGTQGNVLYKEFFAMIKNEKIWSGYSSPGNTLISLETKGDEIISNTKVKQGMTCWYTNISPELKELKEVARESSYYNNPSKYKFYDGRNIIHVPKVSEIPFDYEGIMGVPVSYFSNHNWNNFEIIGISESYDMGQVYIDESKQFTKLFIKAKKK